MRYWHFRQRNWFSVFQDRLMGRRIRLSSLISESLFICNLGDNSIGTNTLILFFHIIETFGLTMKRKSEEAINGYLNICISMLASSITFHILGGLKRLYSHQQVTPPGEFFTVENLPFLYYVEGYKTANVKCGQINL